MHFGENPQLEEAADRLIRESMRGSTSHASKSDILTPWKEQDRRRREVYNPTGVADSSIRRGIFTRMASPTHPHLNSRDGVAPPLRQGASPDTDHSLESLHTFVANNARFDGGAHYDD